MARLYASTYPDEVVGMVLLDITHEDVWLRFQEMREVGSLAGELLFKLSQSFRKFRALVS